MKRAQAAAGVIRSDEGYSKTELLQRLQISQKFWDRMIAEGLPVANIGHAKWVTGSAVLGYIERHSVRSSPDEK